MTLNPILKAEAERLAKPFGGLEIVRQLITQTYLEDILLSPGFTAVVKPWANPKLDLRSFGYIPQTPYRVFNDHYQFLYEERTSGEFGNNTLDIEALVKTSHASYLYIQFENELEPMTGLIWVCNRLSPSQVQENLAIRRDRFKAARRRHTRNELYLETSLLAATGTLKFYYLPEPYIAEPTAQEVIFDDRSEIIESPIVPRILLFPDRPGWYLFTHEQASGIINTLDISGLNGIGLRRIRKNQQGLVYIDTTNQNLNLPQPSDQQLAASTTQTGWLQTDPFIRLDADLIYFDNTIQVETSSTLVISTPPVPQAITVGSSRVDVSPPASQSVQIFAQGESVVTVSGNSNLGESIGPGGGGLPTDPNQNFNVL